MAGLDSSQKVATLLLSFRRTISDELTTFIPIYPNRLPTVPKPPTTSRTPPLVLNNLLASQGAITRLENRLARKGHGGSNPPSSATKPKAVCLGSYRDFAST